MKISLLLPEGLSTHQSVGEHYSTHPESWRLIVLLRSASAGISEVSWDNIVSPHILPREALQGNGRTLCGEKREREHRT